MAKSGFIIVAATSCEGGIGVNGGLPWRNKTDMKYFKNITCQRIDESKINAVIMGRKTFESLDCKPLPNRINVCITSMNPFSATPYFGATSENIYFFSSLDAALEHLRRLTHVENIFVIGGAKLYAEAIEHPQCTELLINRVDCSVECDTFFPEIDSTQYLLAETAKLDDMVTNERYVHSRETYGFPRTPFP